MLTEYVSLVSSLFLGTLYRSAQENNVIIDARRDLFCCCGMTGIFGDQINEMAWAIGEILDTIRSKGMDDNTLALFFSDHGPHREVCEEGGNAGTFAGLNDDDDDHNNDNNKITSPQSHLRKARRSSAHKKNSKLLNPHSPIKYRPTSTAPRGLWPCAAANGCLLIMAAEKPQFSCVASTPSSILNLSMS